MNDTLKVISERYSCRDYKSEMPSDCIIQSIANAAIQAPSGMNRQPWRVIVVKNQTLMGDIESDAMSCLAGMQDKTLYDRIMGRGGKLFYGAPCMFIIPIDQEQKSGATLDCGIVCQNIALAATSLGVANVICGLTRLAFSGARAEEFNKRLGFPVGYAFGCSVLLGYANTPKQPHEPDKEKIIIID